MCTLKGKGWEEEEEERGERQVEEEKGEDNVRVPFFQSMQGLWRDSQGNPSVEYDNVTCASIRF